MSFVSLKAYPILLESLDLHGCLIIYGIGCIFGAIFVLMVLKETRGKPLDDMCVNVWKEWNKIKLKIDHMPFSDLNAVFRLQLILRFQLYFI